MVSGTYSFDLHKCWFYAPTVDSTVIPVVSTFRASELRKCCLLTVLTTLA